MNTAEIRELTDAELDEASGAEPNLGGYTYCHFPHEGLYVGPCQNPPPSMGGLGSSILQAGVAGAAGGVKH